MRPFILGLAPRISDAPFLDTKTLCDRVGQNTGNLAFHEAIDSHLGGQLPVVSWTATPEQIDQAGPMAVIPSANQLGPHADFGNLAKKFSALHCHLMSIGLGAQGNTNGDIPIVPEGTVAWVRQIAEHGRDGVPNISVRGEFTKKVLDHHGLGKHCVVLGCPSLFINPAPNLGEIIASNLRPIKRLAVAAGHPRWTHLGRIEASLAAIVTATGGSYVGQSPFTSIALTRGEARNLPENELRDCRDYACPGMDFEEFVRWSERHGNVFFDIPAWMEHYRRFDFVIGARIHGVMLALQAGIPGVCIVHDSRTLELCQTMMVPHVLARDVSGGIARDQLVNLLKFDADAFDANRREIAKNYVDFLEVNGLSPIPWLKKIAGR
jgi:hypothetical protein